jgi:signal transduction histidine kinase
MHHAVENLLRNALEAQPAGGFIHIELVRAGQDIVLTMSNGGCTLSPEDRDRMPEPYFTTKEAGTGLGLSIARRIIAAHEGMMTIAGRKPGTIAIGLCLPAAKAFPETNTAGKGLP